MALEYTAHAAAAEVRLLAAPAAAQHTVVGAGMESHASFAALSVRQTDAALDAYADALATELVLAAPRATPSRAVPGGRRGTRALFERAPPPSCPRGFEDRPLADDLRAPDLLEPDIRLSHRWRAGAERRCTALSG